MIFQINKDDIDDQLLALFLEADPSRSAIEKYIEKGIIFVHKDDETLKAAAILTTNNDMFELVNIAVIREYRGQGLAKLLIASVKEHVRKLGGNTLFVGTGNSSLDQLALYQKCGFRLHSIVHDFFSEYEEIYENGIRCIDKVVLCASL
eukprot:TRINITY_DN5873_c2_g1_i1.p1 TRINITY_DN5873_c2_g1~~TRINITY_DN5873_c2_g1_i1.p1  ORF type:complete len:149 (+),score=16.41 TRINITY_DN5873_c2_g1_i1:130-576(+)